MKDKGLPKLSFCDEYGYPPEIRELLRRALEQLGPEGALSVYVLGSTARGELSYTWRGEELLLFSDLELCIVRKRRHSGYERQLRQRMEKLEGALPPHTPFFHIDLLFLDPKAMRRAYPIIFNYELKADAKLLYGRETRHLLPDVGPDTIDLGHTNSLLLSRLWAMLLYLPHRILKRDGSASALEETVLQYVGVRNTLDIPTILLPQEKELLPTYRERVKYIRENFQSLAAARYFDEGFPAFLEEALEGKLTLRSRRTGLELYERAFFYYLSLARYLAGLAPECDVLTLSNPDLKDSSPPMSSQHPALQRKQAIYELLICLSHWPKMGWKKGKAWMREDKRPLMLNLLLSLHQATILFLRGKEGFGPWLERSEELMRKLSLSPWRPEEGGDFPIRCQRLRRAYAHFMSRFYIFNRGSYPGWRAILEGTYE